MKKATAVAPANIAFIKYWGKKDEDLRIPLNDSISMNLSGAQTTTTVEFSSAYAADTVELLGGEFSDGEKDRVKKCLDSIRKRSSIDLRARVVTRNTFPKGAGAAASASGFAALTVAGFAAAGKTLSEKELTIFARMGSGSACRSIPDGFVLWEKGATSEESYAHSLYSHTYWDLRDVLVIVDFSMKKVSTTEGQKRVKTSPFWEQRVAGIPGKIERTLKALKEKNFSRLGEVVEEDCLDMHAVMQSQTPPLVYWNDATGRIMDAVRVWRKEGMAAYFTIDAGPNVHILCEGKDERVLIERVQFIPGVLEIIANKPAPGAHVL